ncbi:MAG: hypothetical protein WCJ94_00735 [bacterium]
MKKLLIAFFTLLFAVGMILFIGCGGGTKVKSAADEQNQVTNEASQKNKEELPTTYLVVAGDTLATISEKAEIYGNKYQWPLIFDANKDILDNFKVIKEGIKLIIPRNVSAIEIAAANQRSAQLNWPEAEVKAATGKEAEEEKGEEASATIKTAKSTSSSVAGEGTSSKHGLELQPTAIPEPEKNANNKSVPNKMLLLTILLGIIAVIVSLMMLQKKKED